MSKNMSEYRKQKSKVRDIAIEWQLYLSENAISWGGLMIAQNYFEKVGKRYGLLTEFRENGII